jgi:hypothetical protein
VDLSVRIGATSSKAREAFSQYLACPPLSLRKLFVEEQAGSLLYHTEYSPHFRTTSKLFSAWAFYSDNRKRIATWTKQLTAKEA